MNFEKVFYFTLILAIPTINWSLIIRTERRTTRMLMKKIVLMILCKVSSDYMQSEEIVKGQFPDPTHDAGRNPEFAM